MEDLIAICVYHKFCNDGAAAAACVKIALQDDVEYIPLGYKPDEQNEVFSMLLASPVSSLFFVDISLPVEMIKQLSKAGKEIQIFDHHNDKMRQDLYLALNDNFDPAEWGPISPTFVFDPSHSGAYLAYESFVNSEVDNYPILLVEDRDIWKWKYTTDTEAFFLLMGTTPRTIDDFLHYIQLWDTNRHAFWTALDKGKVLVSFQDQIKANIKRHAYNIHPNVVMLNCPEQFQSDLGMELATDDNVVCLYVVTENGIKLSFRSKNETAQKFAVQFGGGGHPNASGAFSTAPLAVIETQLFLLANQKEI